MQVIIEVVDVVEWVVDGGSPSAHCEQDSIGPPIQCESIEFSHYLQSGVACVGTPGVQML